MKSVAYSGLAYFTPMFCSVRPMSVQAIPQYARANTVSPPIFTGGCSNSKAAIQPYSALNQNWRQVSCIKSYFLAYPSTSTICIAYPNEQQSVSTSPMLMLPPPTVVSSAMPIIIITAAIHTLPSGRRFCIIHSSSGTSTT